MGGEAIRHTPERVGPVSASKPTHDIEGRRNRFREGSRASQGAVDRAKPVCVYDVYHVSLSHSLFARAATDAVPLSTPWEKTLLRQGAAYVAASRSGWAAAWLSLLFPRRSRA